MNVKHQPMVNKFIELNHSDRANNVTSVTVIPYIFFFSVTEDLVEIFSE